MPLYEFYNYRTVADRYVIEANDQTEADELAEVAQANFDEVESECVDGDIHPCRELEPYESERNFISRRELLELSER